MPRSQFIRTQFNRGEVDEEIRGRPDVESHRSGCRTMLNILPQIAGGALCRAGTLFAAEVGDSSITGRLAEFEFSDEQAYVFEIQNAETRVYRDRGRIESPPGTPVTIATPWLTAELSDLQWVQSADVFFAVSGARASQSITRTSHTAWTTAAHETRRGPYLPQNTTATTLAPAATTGSGIQVTASAATFSADDVGRWLTILHGSTWGHAEIVTFTDTTHVDVDIDVDFGGTGAVTEWRLGVFSDGTGWPEVIGLFQERMWVGKNDVRPSGLYGSQVGDWQNHDPGSAADDEAIAAILTGKKVPVLRWLLDNRGLWIGTLSKLMRLRGATDTENLTPANVNAVPEAGRSAKKLQAIEIGAAALFVSRSGKAVREAAYTIERDGLAAPEMTRLARHITEPGIVDWAFAEEPEMTLWVVLDDGTVASFLYDRDQEAFAWARHEIAGTDAFVESVAVVANTICCADDVYFLVRRTIDGGTKRYVEVLVQPLADDEDLEDAVYLDSAVQGTSGTAKGTWTGLDHLEGESVYALADGVPVGPMTVSSGSITLPDGRTALKVTAGLQFRWKLEPMIPVIDDAAGTSEGRMKQISDLKLRLKRSRGLEVGRDENTLAAVDFRTPREATGTPLELFSGVKRVKEYEGEAAEDPRVLMEGDSGLPFHVLSLMATVQVHD